jgi:hypothetical protein
MFNSCTSTPPYSPDLGPLDLFPCPKIKMTLKEIRLQPIDSIINMTDVLSDSTNIHQTVQQKVEKVMAGVHCFSRKLLQRGSV